ncbi:hypothetical protein WJX82_005039 [Trebouxia sp. C0006]
MLLVTVWTVCSDGPHPFVCTEQAGCALAAATDIVAPRQPARESGRASLEARFRQQPRRASRNVEGLLGHTRTQVASVALRKDCALAQPCTCTRAQDSLYSWSGV